MPKRGGRKERQRILRTIGTIVALGLGASGIWWLSQYSSDYVHRQEEGARARSSDPDSKCYTIVGMTPFCIRGDNDARAEAERSEGDLQAQQNMAEWAKFLTILTAIQAGIGGLGLWAIWRGLRHNERATRAATKATKAATSSAVTAEKTYLADRRPWLQLKMLDVLEVRIDRDKSVTATAAFELSCLNKNPADNVMVGFEAFKLSGPPPFRSEIIKIAAEAERRTILEEFSAMVIVPDRPERADRWANVVWRKEDRGSGVDAFRIGIVAVATYRAVGGTETYHTAETYVVRRVVASSDQGRGFFFDSEPATYRAKGLDFSSPPAGRHTT